LVVDEQTDSSRGANDDVIATDVRRRGERILRIANVCDQKKTHLRESPAREWTWRRVIRQGSTVLARDFIPHSIRLDPRCKAQQGPAFWEDVIDENGLEIGNEGATTHPWTREGHEGESVIDLTLAN